MYPEFMYLLFENDLFLGAFEDETAAERLREARVKSGKPISRIAIYRIVRDGAYYIGL